MKLLLENDDRVRVGWRMLAGGAAVSLLDLFFSFAAGEYFRCYTAIGATACLLVLIPVLYRTRSLDLVFGIGGACASLACLMSFLLSGEFYFLALGISIPIGVTMCATPRTGFAVSVIFGVLAIAMTTAITQEWYKPPYGNGEIFRGTAPEALTVLLVLAVIAGTSLYREVVIRNSEEKRQVGDASLQKQLRGSRLLAETASELLKQDPSQERWTELLKGIADHLDCELFTNYEVQNDKLRLVASDGLPDSVIQDYRVLNLGEKLCGTCALGDEVIYIIDSNGSGHPQGQQLIELGFRTIIVVPLKFGGQIVGTLAFASTLKNRFAEEEVDFITTLGQAVASVRGRAIADAQNRVSESRFRTVIDNASHSFFLVDHEWRYVDANLQACLSLGYEREELLQLRVPDVVVGVTFDDLKNIDFGLGEDDFLFRNSRYRRKDGTEFPVEVHLSRVMIDGASYVTSLARDASDRQELADRRIQSQKMEAIGRLAGGVAHDFNNLLCVINSYSEILMADITLTERQRVWMRSIFDAGQRGADLTRQLLVFGRKAVFKPKVIDMNEVVADAQRLLARLIGENIEIQSHLSPNPCCVLADRSQIDQVLINLAVNARDAMPRGGTLLLETKLLRASDASCAGASRANAEHDLAAAHNEPSRTLVQGDCVQLIVSDTGCGIVSEQLTQVFDPFFTTKDVGEGTGLGLAVAYGIAKESGGSIDVTSELDQGSTFTMTLPAHQERTTTLSRRHTAGRRIAPPHLKTRPLVLLVEDEDEVRRVASLSLRQEGYVVLEAVSSRHAIDLARQYADELSVLVTDVVMPDMNGPAIVREIQQFLPNLPVLYMSGYTYDTLSQVTELDDIHILLSKPFKLNELFERVQQTILDHARSSVPSN